MNTPRIENNKETENLEDPSLQYSAKEYRERIEGLVNSIKSKIMKSKETKENNPFVKKVDYSLDDRTNPEDEKEYRLLEKFITSEDLYGQREDLDEVELIKSSLELVVETEKEKEMGGSSLWGGSEDQSLKKSKLKKLILKEEESLRDSRGEIRPRRVPKKSKSIDLTTEKKFNKGPVSDPEFTPRTQNYVKEDEEEEICELCNENFEILSQCVLQKFLLGVENQRLIKIYKETKEENDFLSLKLGEVMGYIEDNYLHKEVDFESVEEERVQEIYKYEGFSKENSKEEVNNFLDLKNISEIEKKTMMEKFLLGCEIIRLENEFKKLKNSYEEIKDSHSHLTEKLTIEEKKVENLIDKIIEQQEGYKSLVEDLEMKKDLIEISKEKIFALEKENQKLQRSLNKTSNAEVNSSSLSPRKGLVKKISENSLIEKVENEGLKKRISILEKRLFEQSKEKSILEYKYNQEKNKVAEGSFFNTPNREKLTTDSFQKNVSISSIPTNNFIFKSQREDLIKMVEDQWKEIKNLEKNKKDLINKNLQLSHIIQNKSESRDSFEESFDQRERTKRNLENWEKLNKEIEDYFGDLGKSSFQKMDESYVIRRDNRDYLRKVSSEGNSFVFKV